MDIRDKGEDVIVIGEDVGYSMHRRTYIQDFGIVIPTESKLDRSRHAIDISNGYCHLPESVESFNRRIMPRDKFVELREIIGRGKKTPVDIPPRGMEIIREFSPTGSIY